MFTDKGKVVVEIWKKERKEKTGGLEKDKKSQDMGRVSEEGKRVD